TPNTQRIGRPRSAARKPANGCCSASEPTLRPPLCRTCRKRNRRENAGAAIRTRAVDWSQGPVLGSAGIEFPYRNAYAQPHTPRIPPGGARRADFSDSDGRDTHRAARCGVMEWSLAPGVGVMGWLHTSTRIAAGMVWHVQRPWPMRPEAEQRAQAHQEAEM